MACLVAFGVFLFKLNQSSFVERRSNPLVKRDFYERIVAELVASIIAGLLGGWLLWLIAIKLFPDPRRVLHAAFPIRWAIDNAGGLDAATAAYVTFAVPLVLGVLFLQAVVFVGASSQHNHDFDREWWARASGWVLIAGLAWIVLAVIAIYGPVAVHHLPRALSTVGGAAGAFSLIAGWSAKTNAAAAPGEQSKKSQAVGIALAIAVPLFAAYLLALISLGTTWTIKKMQPELAAPVRKAERDLIEEARKTNKKLSDEELLARELRKVAGAQRTLYEPLASHQKASITEKPVVDLPLARAVEHLLVVRNANPLIVLLFAVGGPILAFLFSRAIGVNVFSMHAMYRNRLVRAYLGASRWRRDPNSFTGFDPDDNLSMDELRPEYVWAHSFGDFDAAVRKLTAAAPDTKAGFLRDQIRDALGSDAAAIFENGGQLTVRRQALCKALNILIATRDLPALHDSAPEAHCVLRPLRNRRFIELVFDDAELYPSPMPLLCQADLVSPNDFVEAIYANGAVPDGLRRLFSAEFCASVKNGRPSIGALIGEINLVITTAILAKDPVFRGAGISARAAPYQWLDHEPVHRMIDNRLRLDHEFSTLLIPLSQARPLHVVNICLNLTSGDDLARQERKGASLTVSPLASGSHLLGYRDTRTYGEISLGTAVTISGAAASPNMGYHSSPALAFLMTLFNVRLGWWLGNPGFAGAKTHQRRNPKWSITPFLYEATGNTNERYAYVYLSDGGHFENLGFYEMVLRRCHSIVITDAGADPGYAYDDLGNAIRKIGIDLGIPIRIDEDGIIPPAEQAEKDKLAHKYCAVGRICYSKVDGENAVDGEFLYIKPVVYKENGPRDVRNYAKISAKFPHESTADQFFSETQFESYRHLGFFATDTIATHKPKPPSAPPAWPPESWKHHPVSALIERARSYLL